jgi:hypothetical protein
MGVGAAVAVARGAAAAIAEAAAESVRAAAESAEIAAVREATALIAGMQAKGTTFPTHPRKSTSRSVTCISFVHGSVSAGLRTSACVLSVR